MVTATSPAVTSFTTKPTILPRPRSAFGFRRYLARACHGPDGVGSCPRLHDISAFRARRRGACVRCALLYPLSYSLLRARIRLPRWDRRISRYSRGKTVQQVSWFFFTRGLWLVLLEFTIIDFAWGFVPWGHAGVIWILGWSMVAMALIVWLPLRWIAALGLGMIATHNLLDRINPASFGKFYWLWIMLHTPGRIPITAHLHLSVRYVLIPSVGVIAAGFAFGSLLRPDHRKWILTIGLSATVLFFVLRGLNLYGNGIAGLPFGFPRSAGPWSVQPTLSLTLVSFFNTLKYPPSLDYLLMTLGPSLTLIGLLDASKAERGLNRILLVFGRVPLFYSYCISTSSTQWPSWSRSSFINPFCTAPSSQTSRRSLPGTVTGYLLSTLCGFWPWQFCICRVGGSWNSAASIAIGVGSAIYDGAANAFQDFWRMCPTANLRTATIP